MYLHRCHRFLRRGLPKKSFQVIVAAIRTIHADSSIKGALQELKDLAVTPEQPELYEEAVKIYNPAYACEHPAFVTFPNNTEDIKRCLQIAAKTCSSVAIKSGCLLYTSPSPRDLSTSRMPSSA